MDTVYSHLAERRLGSAGEAACPLPEDLGAVAAGVHPCLTGTPHVRTHCLTPRAGFTNLPRLTDMQHCFRPEDKASRGSGQGGFPAFLQAHSPSHKACVPKAMRFPVGREAVQSQDTLQLLLTWFVMTRGIPRGFPEILRAWS